MSLAAQLIKARRGKRETYTDTIDLSHFLFKNGVLDQNSSTGLVPSVDDTQTGSGNTAVEDDNSPTSDSQNVVHGFDTLSSRPLLFRSLLKEKLQRRVAMRKRNH